MKKHTILFLAANPSGTDRRALDREARAIQIELERAGSRDCFELVTRWAVEPLDLLRELRKLKPTVVHFSGHGTTERGGRLASAQASARDVDGEHGGDGGAPQHGLFLHGPHDGVRLVSTAALEEAFAAAGGSVRLVVLNACYSEPQAKALLAHVDCVVGMDGTIDDHAARSFAIGFYGGLGEREPVANAYQQGQAAISLEGMHGGEHPLLRVRDGVDASRLVLAEAPAPPPSPSQAAPIDFTAERQRHGRFVGRDDVLARLDEWLLGPKQVGWAVVTGGPGMGKSAILSAWLARREAAGAVVPHHFIRRQVADWDQPEVIAISLAAQIEAAYPDLRDPAAKPERRLIDLLGRVSKRTGSTTPLVLVVDGLDEIRAEPGDNPLPRCLPHVVPAGIRILCATRPTHPHLGWIEAHGPMRGMDLDQERWGASNEAAVRGFWAVVAAEYQPPLPAAAVANAIAAADGNMLHAVMLHDALRDLPAPERDVDRIPRGLKQMIGELWDRAALQGGTRVGLGLLCAAREALSLDVLCELTGWSYEAKERFVRDARQLLLEEPAAWAGREAYRPRHDWVRELISGRLGEATMRGHHQTLSRQLATWPPPIDEPRRRYAVRHALAHRIAVHDWSGIRTLASNLGYLEARAHAADVFVLEQELKNAGAMCPDAKTVRDLADLAWALARESHWVRQDPKGTTGLIWNRLRRGGWSLQELDALLTVPAETAFLRVRHAASRESGLLERTLQGHRRWVRACAVTPDGRHVVSASDDGTLKVWDLDAGHVLATLEGHASGVAACAVTPDGRSVVSASDDGTLKVWDLDAGRVLATLEGHAAGVTACAVTPDGRRVVSASEDRSLKIWDLAAGSVLATLKGHTWGVTACAVTPDGRRVVSASTDRTLKIWDLASGHALATLQGHEWGVTACAVTANGDRVVSASTDRMLKIWNPATGRVLATLERHSDGVTACAVAPGGQRMISASMDRRLKVWDLSAGRFLGTLEGHSAGVTACVVTPGGERVISASHDCTLKIWDLDASRILAAPSSHAARVNACTMTPSGRRVVSASHDRTLKIWEVDQGQVIATLNGHTDPVTACALTNNGWRVISASADRSVRIWDLDSDDHRRTLSSRYREQTLGLAAKASARGLLSALAIPDDLERRSPRVNDAIRVHATLEEVAASERVCAVTPNGRHVVSVPEHGSLTVWDFMGRVVATLAGHSDVVTGCAMVPDGQRLVSASRDGTLRVWELTSGRALATLVGHTEGVRACTVTPDGQHVISASSDGTLKVWNLASGHALTTFHGHADQVTGCAVTPDGQRVISVSSDSTLKVWDLASASCLLTHRGDTAFLCVAAAEEVIVAGDRAGTVWFFDGPRSALQGTTPVRRFAAPSLTLRVTSTIEVTVAHDRVAFVPLIPLPSAAPVTLGSTS
jgi:WD40 repeat protein